MIGVGVVTLGSASARSFPAAKPKPKTVKADHFVSATGNDAGRCTAAAPCATFNRAYRIAEPGEVVEVAGGTYPEQQIDPDPRKKSGNDVIFRAAPKAQVTVTGPLNLYASHVTVERIRASDLSIVGEIKTYVPQTDVTAKNVTATTLQIDSATDVRVLGGNFGPSIGNNSGIRKNGPTMTGRIVIDGAHFHDYRCPPDYLECHIECLIVGAVDGLTIRNSRFEKCAIYNIYFSSFNGTISNVTLDKNWFAAPTGPDGQGTGSQAVRFAAGWSFDRLVIRSNSFGNPFGIGSPASNSQVIRNVGRLDPFDPPGGCGDPAISYQDNIWENVACGPTDRQALFGYVAASGTLRPEKQQAAVISKIFTQAERGRGLDRIARDLRRARAPAPDNVRWDVTTLRKVLGDATYLGGRYGPKGAHPALVSSRIWRAVQARLKSR